MTKREERMVRQYDWPYQPNNIETLDARLREVFGARYLAMGSSDEGLWFHFLDEKPSDVETLAAELRAHDPRAPGDAAERQLEKATVRARLKAVNFDQLRQSGRNQQEILDAVLNILEDVQRLLDGDD